MTGGRVVDDPSTVETLLAESFQSDVALREKARILGAVKIPKLLRDGSGFLERAFTFRRGIEEWVKSLCPVGAACLVRQVVWLLIVSPIANR
jgi:hypothetical protein